MQRLYSDCPVHRICEGNNSSLTVYNSKTSKNIYEARFITLNAETGFCSSFQTSETPFKSDFGDRMRSPDGSIGTMHSRLPSDSVPGFTIPLKIETPRFQIAIYGCLYTGIYVNSLYVCVYIKAECSYRTLQLYIYGEGTGTAS